jgi:ComF family protein
MLPRIGEGCARCGLPLPAATPPGIICGLCQQRPPAFDRCIAPFLYAPPMDQLISSLKYERRLACARLLGELLADHLQAVKAPRPDAIAPVPLNAERVRERGFNQALEIGRVVGRQLEIPLLPRHIHRVRNTASQAGLDRAERRKNVQRAFEIRRPTGDRHVAILDDVVTTGSTAGEIAGILKAAGVAEVSVWAVARTPETPAR